MSELLERLETLTYSFDGRAKMREIAKAEVLVSIATTAEQGAEIARLLAVEVAAKEMADNCQVYRASTNETQCRFCVQREVLEENKFITRHSKSCPVLVIYPIGDK